MTNRMSTLARAAATALLVTLLAACDSTASSAATSASAPNTASAPAPEKFSSTPAKAFADIESKTTGFSVGPSMAAHVAYVFFDPQCPHCAHMWQSAQTVGSAARFVWIPVGLLSRASAPQGATIVGAEDPAKAMAQNEESVLAHQGGITVDNASVDRLKAKVEENTAFFNSIRSRDDGVPFIVTKVNGVVQSQSGSMPPDMLKRFLGIEGN